MLDVNAVRAAILKRRAVFGGTTTVYLNPADLAGLEPGDRQMLTAGGGITLVSDPEVAPGGFSIGKG